MEQKIKSRIGMLQEQIRNGRDILERGEEGISVEFIIADLAAMSSEVEFLNSLVLDIHQTDFLKDWTILC